MAGVVSFVRGESETQGVSVEGFGFTEGLNRAWSSPGTKEIDKDDNSLPKVLGDDRNCRSIVASTNPWQLTCQTCISSVQRLVAKCQRRQ